MSAAPVKPMRRGWVLLALMLTMMLAAMDTTIVGTAMPQIVGDLGGFSLFSWLFSIYLLVQTVTIPVYGKIADITGRKSVLVVGVSIFLAGSAACAAAMNMHALIWCRALQGVGAGAIMATVNTIAGDIYTVRERANIEGWLSSVWGISAVLGPAIGGALAEYASWRWIFLINIPVGVAAMVLLGIYFTEQKAPKRHHIDWAGAAAMMAAGTAIIFGLLQGGQAWPWFSLPTLGFAAGSALLVWLTFRIERRSAEPILPGWIWRERSILGSNLATVGMGIILMGPNMFLPVFAQSVTGLNAMAAGFVLASMSLSWPIASALSGRMYLRAGFRNTALAGAIVLVVSSAGFLLVSYPGSVWLMTAIQVALGVGFGLLTTPLLVGVQSTVEWGRRGVVTGANIFSRYLGSSIGAAVFAAVFNTTLTARIAAAPVALRAELPGVNQVVGVLQSHHARPEVETALQHLLYSGTLNVYLGQAVAGLLVVGILCATPAIFRKIKGEG